MKALALAAAATLLAAAAPLTSQQALDSAAPADWQLLDPDRLLVMDLPGGRVTILLAPDFAPQHIANIKTLVGQRFFDTAAVVRVQDNYVAQWGDPTDKAPIGAAKASLPLEADRPAKGLVFTPIRQRDAYAREVGFVDGFAVARGKGRAWMTYCYGVVGVGRNQPPESGNGAELFAIIGHAPRHLDRNYTPVGRVVDGIETLSSLPRGTAALGFYAEPAQRAQILRVRLASELPPAQRPRLEQLRTDSAAFRAYVAARANRDRDGFVVGFGGVDLCNIRVPVRPAQGAK